MAIVKVRRRADAYNVEGTFGNWYINGAPLVYLSGSLVYDAYSDDKDDLPLQVMFSPLLPQVGELYGEYGTNVRGVYYTKSVPRFVGPVGSYWLWEVTLSIGGATSDSPEPSEGETPEPTLLAFSWDVERDDWASRVDADGKSNVNTVGDWFADPILFKDATLNMNFRRREYSNPLGLSKTYFETVNNATLWGFPAGTVAVADIVGTTTQTASETTYDVEYRLKYRKRGWNDVKTNSGLYYRASAGGDLILATNADGSPSDEPVLLAANGTRLAANAEPHWLTFRTKEPADLSALGLPNPFEL